MKVNTCIYQKYVSVHLGIKIPIHDVRHTPHPRPIHIITYIDSIHLIRVVFFLNDSINDFFGY